MRFSIPHRRRRVFSFFDFRSSFSRFSDFIKLRAKKKRKKKDVWMRPWRRDPPRPFPVLGPRRNARCHWTFLSNHSWRIPRRVLSGGANVFFLTRTDAQRRLFKSTDLKPPRVARGRKNMKSFFLCSRDYIALRNRPRTKRKMEKKFRLSDTNSNANTAYEQMVGNTRLIRQY